MKSNLTCLLAHRWLSEKDFNTMHLRLHKNDLNQSTELKSNQDYLITVEFNQTSSVNKLDELQSQDHVKTVIITYLFCTGLPLLLFLS